MHKVEETVAHRQQAIRQHKGSNTGARRASHACMPAGQAHSRTSAWQVSQTAASQGPSHHPQCTSQLLSSSPPLLWQLRTAKQACAPHAAGSAVCHTGGHGTNPQVRVGACADIQWPTWAGVGCVHVGRLGVCTAACRRQVWRAAHTQRWLCGPAWGATMRGLALHSCTC